MPIEILEAVSRQGVPDADITSEDSSPLPIVPRRRIDPFNRVSERFSPGRSIGVNLTRRSERFHYGRGRGRRSRCPQCERSHPVVGGCGMEIMRLTPSSSGF